MKIPSETLTYNRNFVLQFPQTYDILNHSIINTRFLRFQHARIFIFLAIGEHIEVLLSF